MNLVLRPCLSAMLLAVLTLLASSASAGMTPEEVKAFEGYKAKAEQGDAGAQNSLGLCYYLGRGVAKDYDQAVNLWRKGADQGDAYAQHYLANRYAKGEGVARDPVQAVNLWHKSAEQGNAWAQFELGTCYIFGRGLAKDEIEAYAYWSIAGITYAPALESLAVLQKQMSEGQIAAGHNRSKELQKGIEAKIAAKKAKKAEESPENVEAFEGYKTKAENGDASAQFQLGVCYVRGIGVTADEVEGVKWYRKASEQGYATAQSRLGSYYALLRYGVAKDEVEAYADWSLAGITDELSRGRLVGLEKKMSAGQIAAGQKRSKELQKGIEAKIAATKKAELQKEIVAKTAVKMAEESPEKVKAFEGYKTKAENGDASAQ